MTQKYFAITMISAAALMVSACESLPKFKGSENPIRVVNADGTTAPPPAISTGGASGLERLDNMAGGQFPPPNERDLMVITDKLSGGSIEIYDLDSASPRTYGGRAAETRGGMPSSSDSSVMVYPVDGGSAYPGQMGLTWPNSILPSNTLAGYDGAPASAGGRTSPHVGSGYAPSQIYFKHGSSRLGSGDRQVLRQVADQAKFAPVERIAVEGHASTRTGIADPVESKIVNLKASMNRAINVSSQLMRDGVPAEKIRTTVWGDTKSAGLPEAESRRVDIITGAQ